MHRIWLKLAGMGGKRGHRIGAAKVTGNWIYSIWIKIKRLLSDPRLNFDLPRVRLQWILLWDKQWVTPLRVVNEKDLWLAPREARFITCIICSWLESLLVQNTPIVDRPGTEPQSHLTQEQIVSITSYHNEIRDSPTTLVLLVKPLPLRLLALDRLTNQL
jgi:hypothetical protein